MATQSKYICQQCGYESAKWLGRCIECGEWNSLVETVVTTTSSAGRIGRTSRKGEGIKPVFLAEVPSKNISRISTKIPELDRVLGGGLVGGQVILIAGEPGIGKSTLLLQVAEELASSQRSSNLGKTKMTKVHRQESSVLYISGEESINQIALRAQRLGINSKRIQIMEETDVDQVIQVVQVEQVGQKIKTNSSTTSATYSALIIDSIQTMATSDLSGMAGSVGQVRECAYRLIRLAKSRNIPTFIVGHVTKEGSVAGPSVLMHLVDTVLWFEGEKSLTLRLLRAIKNRFGPTDEVGIFSMEEKGLLSISDSSKLFLSQLTKQVPGSAITSVMKGTRPILIEIQSLIVPTKLAFPRRIAQGMDSKRLEMLLAVLTRRCGLSLYDFDVFVNVTGGINLRNDPSCDLAVCLSIASSYFEKALPRNSLIIGEVGLLGDIREVVAQEKRIKEAKRLGYRNIISNREAKYLQQAINKYLK